MKTYILLMLFAVLFIGIQQNSLANTNLTTVGIKPLVQEVKDSIETYTCSMHPEIISDKPGKCPKCGMDLILKNSASGHEMGCMGMMHQKKEKKRGMMYATGGAIMVAMMAFIMFFRFQ